MSLLEVLIAITLLVMVAGTLGWKVNGMIEKKRFTSNVERLRSRLLTCRRLAVNMQSDWQGQLYFQKSQAFFSTRCIDDPSALELKTFLLGPLQFFLNGEECKKISFDFTSTGDILPQGSLEIRDLNKNEVKWDLADIFSLKNGKNAGPENPDNLP